MARICGDEASKREEPGYRVAGLCPTRVLHGDQEEQLRREVSKRKLQYLVATIALCLLEDLIEIAGWWHGGTRRMSPRRGIAVNSFVDKRELDTHIASDSTFLCRLGFLLDHQQLYQISYDFTRLKICGSHDVIYRVLVVDLRVNVWKTRASMTEPGTRRPNISRKSCKLVCEEV
jgi:hypothetical protein